MRPRTGMCPNNHELRRNRQGKSWCPECNKERSRARRAAQKAAREQVEYTYKCGNPECGIEFTTIHKKQMQCSPACTYRVSNIRRSQRVQASRLPIEPLLAYAERWDIEFPVEGWPDGKIGFFQADEYAVKRLGVHPALVYGNQWWEAAAVA